MRAAPCECCTKAGHGVNPRSSGVAGAGQEIAPGRFQLSPAGCGAASAFRRSAQPQAKTAWLCGALRERRDPARHLHTTHHAPRRRSKTGPFILMHARSEHPPHVIALQTLMDSLLFSTKLSETRSFGGLHQRTGINRSALTVPTPGGDRAAPGPRGGPKVAAHVLGFRAEPAPMRTSCQKAGAHRPGRQPSCP